MKQHITLTAITVIMACILVVVVGSCYQQGDPPPPADRVYLFDGTAAGTWEGGSLQTVPEPPSGGSYLRASADADVIVLVNRALMLDLSSYAAAGKLFLEFYVDNPANIIGGQFELTSSSESDRNEIHLDLTDFMPSLTAGWNTLELLVSAMGTQGGACDMTMINYSRFFILISGTTTIGLGPTWVE